MMIYAGVVDWRNAEDEDWSVVKVLGKNGVLVDDSDALKWMILSSDKNGVEVFDESDVVAGRLTSCGGWDVIVGEDEMAWAKFLRVDG